MRCSRRQLIRGGFAVAALGLLRARPLHAADIRFSTSPFTLGVASGYPETTAIVLWTRLAPEPLAPGGGMPGQAVAVDWELAEDDAFRRIRRSGRAYATADWSHSVHVEAAGLEPGRDYWYRFTSGGQRSPTGRTRTAPAGAASSLKIAVASCQHYESGHYAAYGAMANDGLDLVVHVGDYIYEGRGTERVRSHPEPECYTLDDYRLRYTIYKLDPLLQAAHASCPWMLTWDDHEVDNDYAAWHSVENDSQELFLMRRAAAYRAYYEHLPLPRRMTPFGPHQRLHTRRPFGALAEIFMLDGRQYRSPQACGDGLVSPCRELFEARRTMLGQQQELWLQRRLASSDARWKLLGQQTVFAHMDQQPGPELGYWNDGWSGYPEARQRLLDHIAERGIANPLILSGDIHAFLANDVHATPGDLDSRVIATEIVTTSLSSLGPPQTLLDSWRDENANVHLARSDVRGYTRLTIRDTDVRVELIGVEDIRRADSSTYVLASYDIAEGRPGIPA
jgi:alkaline phosphatase D